MRHKLATGVLLAACFLTYSNSLQNNFLIDDHALILDNAQIRSINSFPLTLTPKVASGEPRGYYRPVHHALIMSNYLCFGTNPLGYHLVNLFFLYICAMALYGFVNLLFQNRKISFLTSLFFCVHPINGMLVNYVTATGCATIVFFMLLSLIFYLLAEKSGKRIYGIMSFLCFVIALLCHETAMVFPLYLAAVLFLAKGYSLKQTMQKIWPYCLLAFVYFVFRLQFASLNESVIDQIPRFQMSFASYSASFFKLMLEYIARLVFLQDIVLSWSVSIVKENLFWWNSGFILTILGSLYLILGRRESRIRSFALSWFLIGFLPVTMACLLQPSYGLQIEPHWLSFATIGFFLFSANAMIHAGERIHKNLFKVLVLLLLGVYILNSRYYNYLWGEEKRYCQYWLRVAPRSLMTKFFLANVYLQDKEYGKAKQIYEELLSGHWHYPKIYNNLGLIEYAEGNFPKSVEYFRKSLALEPGAVAYTNLGAVLVDLKDWKGAEDAYLRAAELNSFLIEPRFNLAVIYSERKEYKKASDLLRQILAIDPEDEVSAFLLADLSLLNGDKKQALDLTKRILAESKDPRRLVNLGSRFAQERLSNMAFALYSRALKIDPCYKEAYIEMGKVFGNRDQFNQAIVMWQEGLKCHPREKVFVELIFEAKELLKEKTGKSE